MLFIRAQQRLRIHPLGSTLFMPEPISREAHCHASPWTRSTDKFSRHIKFSSRNKFRRGKNNSSSIWEHFNNSGSTSKRSSHSSGLQQYFNHHRSTSKHSSHSSRLWQHSNRHRSTSRRPSHSNGRHLEDCRPTNHSTTLDRRRLVSHHRRLISPLLNI
jgi:hypothetical protein